MAQLLVFVRVGSNVSFKLMPNSGYRPDEAKLQAWVAGVKIEDACNELSFNINADKL